MSATVAIVIVGNEILSGRTREKNAWWLATQLTPRGIKVQRIYVIPDEKDVIETTVRDVRDTYTYTIVCGGIGSTPDDVTREAVAAACDRPCLEHPEAAAMISTYYGERCNAHRLAMACLPEGAALIPNPLSGAPGFSVDSVFVLPGIPDLVHAMFPYVLAQLTETPYAEQEIPLFIGECDCCDILETAHLRFPDVAIGSYPRTRPAPDGRCATILLTGENAARVVEVTQWLATAIDQRTHTVS